MPRRFTRLKQNIQRMLSRPGRRRGTEFKVSLFVLLWYSNTMKTTIDRAGRVVIPKSIREAAGLRPGTPIEIAYREGKVEIEPRGRPVELVWERNVLVAHTPGAPKLTTEEVNEYIRKVREGEL